MNKTKIIVLASVIVALFLAAGFYVDSQKGITNNPAGVINQANVPTSSSSAENTTGQEKIDFANYGKAPEFQGIEKWLNSGPLTMAEFKGKVVLIDFWTYSCINCIRTLPHVTGWYDTYKDKGLVVIGVHTPEFAFEKDSGNVSDAIQRFNIHYPVAQDNDYGTWNSYNNQYWPAEYLVDQNGTIVYEHFGEGNYDRTENAIRSLLGLTMSVTAGPQDSLNKIGSPEMYFGTDRLSNLASTQSPSSAPFTYQIGGDPPLNTFALGGEWQFTGQNVQLIGGEGEIRLKFHSGKIYIVASSGESATLSITVDGKSQKPVFVKDSELYTLFDSNDYSDHLLDIRIDKAGFKAFTFTFG